MINVDNALWLLMEKDPNLNPYAGEIRMHLDRYNDRRWQLNQDAYLPEFANGYNYFGLHRTESGWVFRTDLYEYIGDMSCRRIDSDILGKAFEPEQRFENPDGTAIVFDTDYFGKHRGTRVIPGPFAAPVKEGVVK
jgi:hypothetical protein